MQKLMDKCIIQKKNNATKFIESSSLDTHYMKNQRNHQNKSMFVLNPDLTNDEPNLFFEDSTTPINGNNSFKGKEIKLSIETKTIKPKPIARYEYQPEDQEQTVGDLTQTANNSETKTLYFIGFDRNIYNTSGSSNHFRKFEQHSLLND